LCSELNLTGLLHLQKLDCNGCVMLTHVQGTNTLVALQHLDLSRSLCSELNLTGLSHLQRLDLGHCYQLTDAQGIDTLVALQVLDLSCSQLSTALDLSKLASLTQLNLLNCTALPAVAGISKLVNLVRANLHNCNMLQFPISSNAAVTIMTALESLEVSSNSALAYFQAQKLPVLVNLEVYGIDSITTIDCSSWPSLTRVIVSDCSNLMSLQGLDKLTSLEQLWFTQCPQLQCLPELNCLKTLQSLSISGCTKLSSIYDNLTIFEALVELDVDNSGIDLAMIEGTDNNLLEQVSVLQQRPGFRCIPCRYASEHDNTYYSDQLDEVRGNDPGDCSNVVGTE
jgi:hypothetical protein